MGYNWDFGIIIAYKWAFINGFIITLALTFLSIIIGTIIGFILTYLLNTKSKLVSNLSKSYILFFRAVPLLILLIWIYYSFPLLFNIRLSSFQTTIIAFSLSLSAFVAETARSAFESIPTNQIDSAKIIGFTKIQIYSRIVFPQAIRQMIPNLMNEYISLFKFSGIASIIAVNELLHSSTNIISITYRPIEVYTFIALIYTVFVLFFIFISKRIEHKLLMKIAKSNENFKKIAWWKSQ